MNGTKHQLLKTLVIVVGMAVVVQAADADELTVYASKDTYIDSGYPTTNYGTDNTWYSSYNENLALFAFDVSALPENYQVQSITLSIYIKKFYTTSSVYAISEANGNWTETGATWNTKDGTNAWAGGQGGLTVAGTDYNSTALGTGYLSTTADFQGQYNDITFTGTSAQLTSLVDSWLDGQNEGLMMTLTYRPFIKTLESGTATAPKLTVEYTVVPEPATMAVLGFGGVMVLVARRRRNAA